MTVTRTESETLAHRIRTSILNRPAEDDMFSFPEEFYEAMSRAHDRIRRKVADHAPDLLTQGDTITTSDGGESYDLTDFPLGGLLVYEPPGPPSGLRLYPALPESNYFGFWVEGSTLYLTLAHEYDPLYITWMPETADPISAETNHTLPRYCEDLLAYTAAGILAEKEGFAGNPEKFHALATKEWSGDRRDPSDTGILSRLKRSSMNAGFETHAGQSPAPWWKNIR